MTSLDDYKPGETSMSQKIKDNSEMSSSEGKKCAKEYDLLLLGRTGNGKSATGNSILGRKAFIASATSTSVTNKIKRKSSICKDTILNVVDAPGVLDTGALNVDDNGSTSMKITKKLQEAVESNPRGYNACILVAKYGNRFTEEERNAIHMLKQIFGEDFVRHFCLLVMTNGDTFDAEENKFTFEQWILEQTGCFSDVLHDCGSRVVLFDNITKDKKKKEKQVDELIALVDKIAAKKLRYTNSHFQKALKSRTAFLVQLGSGSIKKRFLSESIAIISEIESIELEDPDERLPLLEKKLETVKELINKIIKEDQGTDVFKDEKDTVWSLKAKLEMDVMMNKRISEERKKHRKEAARQEEIMSQNLKVFDEKIEMLLQAQKEKDEKMEMVLQAQKEKEEKMEILLQAQEDMKKEERNNFAKETARRDEMMIQHLKEKDENMKMLFQAQKEKEEKMEIQLQAQEEKKREEMKNFAKEIVRREEIMNQYLKEKDENMKLLLQAQEEMKKEERNNFAKETARRDEIMIQHLKEKDENMKMLLQAQKEKEEKMEIQLQAQEEKKREKMKKFAKETARRDEMMSQHLKEKDERMEQVLQAQEEMRRKLEEEMNKKSCTVQ